MGYFSNGSEGFAYVVRYCIKCANYRDLGDGRGEGCPVYDMHLLHNGNEMLDALIPRSACGCINEQCKMFLEVK
jgi:hypothetical protein